MNKWIFIYTWLKWNQHPVKLALGNFLFSDFTAVISKSLIMNLIFCSSCSASCVILFHKASYKVIVRTSHSTSNVAIPWKDQVIHFIIHFWCFKKL